MLYHNATVELSINETSRSFLSTSGVVTDDPCLLLPAEVDEQGPVDNVDVTAMLFG
jgi:hypothetical protein